VFFIYFPLKIKDEIGNNMPVMRDIGSILSPINRQEKSKEKNHQVD